MTNEQTQPKGTDLLKTASIDDVFLALRTPHLGATIEMTDEQGRVFKASVRSLHHEDGSGRSLVISGYAELMRATVKRRIFGLRYEAYLNYKGGGRRGWIKFLDYESLDIELFD